jgi:hypothetical protein
MMRRAVPYNAKTPAGKFRLQSLPGGEVQASRSNLMRKVEVSSEKKGKEKEKRRREERDYGEREREGKTRKSRPARGAGVTRLSKTIQPWNPTA